MSMMRPLRPADAAPGAYLHFRDKLDYTECKRGIQKATSQYWLFAKLFCMLTALPHSNIPGNAAFLSNTFC